VLSRTPGSIACPAPTVGADFRAVLALAGYASEDVDELVRSGAVAAPGPESTGRSYAPDATA
jgi:crotonobetainyl-CoA:carnitine CoA-transferase CaiB-like acyl-CoA transferase